MYRSMEEMLEEAFQRGVKIGIYQARLESVKNIMESHNLTVQQAMDVLAIPAEEQPKYLEKI